MQFCRIILKIASVQQRATCQITISEKRGGLVTALQQFKQKREEFTFVEEKYYQLVEFQFFMYTEIQLKFDSSTQRI